MQQAIVRPPSPSLIQGITTAALGQPQFDTALKQHAAYVAALERCGLTVTSLSSDDRFPDATFVEDVALLTPACAILTRPGAASRLGETELMLPALSQLYQQVERIHAPGTVEAGDIMRVGNHYFIGLSQRTNRSGAEQVIQILQRHGMTGSLVPVTSVLHLKTGVTYLENNKLLVAGTFQSRPEFAAFDKILVDDDEAYAANGIWINDRVLMPSGFPKTYRSLSQAGFDIIELEMSEFQKIDGGLTCLSLRF